MADPNRLDAAVPSLKLDPATVVIVLMSALVSGAAGAGVAMFAGAL